ncbi:MAG: hypothetical protein ACREHG_01020, partial [Candidatus Saccharimonadales bacterium]
IITPGVKSSFSFQIINVTGEPVPVMVSAEPLQGAANQSDPLMGWISISAPDAILQPKQPLIETATISAPVNAEPGGHYSTIYVTPLVPADSLSNQRVQQIVRVGAMVFGIVKGNIVERESISGFSSNGYIKQSGPIDFNVRVSNTGNVHLLSHGDVTIYANSGKRQASLKLPDTVILPKTTKNIPMSWSNPDALGKYSAVARITYGVHHTTLTSDRLTFWVLPWIKYVLYAVILAAILYLTKRTHGRWLRALRALRGK